MYGAFCGSTLRAYLVLNELSGMLTELFGILTDLSSVPTDLSGSLKALFF